MKLCPTCKKTFIDQNLSFCIDDGTPLKTVDSPSDESTLVGPSTLASGGGEPPLYQAPRSYTPPDSPRDARKRKVWPWVLGILAMVMLALAALVVAGAIFIPKMMRTASNSNTPNYDKNVQPDNNANSSLNGSNSNTQIGNANGNDNSATLETQPAPTDEAEVLSDLTDLEHEWTVANINADKKKLDRILADDYVGISEGKAQGKAEYLKTIERDASIEKWDFEDLKVSLKGDRAVLTGTIRLVLQDQNVAYRFTDKFVWRDGRWQATGSEVTPLKD